MTTKYFRSFNLFNVGCCFISIGIPCDGFLRGFQNLGLLLILISTVLNYKNINWHKLFEPETILLVSMFLFCALGYFYNGNINRLNSILKLKSLLILFPLAFLVKPMIDNRTKRLAFFLFIIVSTLIAVLSCVNYFMYFNEYNQFIRQSKAIHIIGGTMHIYFSLSLAISIFLGGHLLFEEWKTNPKGNCYKFVFSLIIIDIISLHILSIRTGLFAFYITFFILLIRHYIKTKIFKPLLIGSITIAFVPIAMYYFLPSVKNRLNNTYEDLQRYFTGDYVGYFSISGRFETWKVSLRIFEEHMLFGTGYGDLQGEMESHYLLDTTRLMREESLPNSHNQYIEILAANGIIGFLIFSTLLFFMIKRIKYQETTSYLMCAMIALFLTGFLVESFLERQAGVFMFLYFYYLIKDNINPKKELINN